MKLENVNFYDRNSKGRKERDGGTFNDERKYSFFFG